MANLTAPIAAWAETRGLLFRHCAGTGFGAVFSRCLQYRYLLWRLPVARRKPIGLGMLNPSTADEHRDDPTIARCRRLAGDTGNPNVLIWNLFAYRATDPAVLKAAAAPIGPENDAAIDLALTLAPRTLLAWGNHGRHRGRGSAVMERCRASNTRLAILGLTLQGEPRHPLYLPGDVRPKPLRRGR